MYAREAFFYPTLLVMLRKMCTFATVNPIF